MAEILDLRQFRSVTMDDEGLMRELLRMLLDDSARQLKLLQAAIARRDAAECRRLAHYSKGACANLGAQAAAAVLGQMEQQAQMNDFQGCRASLDALAAELDRLRQYRLDAVHA